MTKEGRGGACRKGRELQDEARAALAKGAKKTD